MKISGLNPVGSDMSSRLTAPCPSTIPDPIQIATRVTPSSPSPITFPISSSHAVTDE